MEIPQPAPKLQKTDEGDVADASQAQAYPTPSALPDSLQAAEDVQQRIKTENAAASGNAADHEKGKKRKVALYVAYIGAGYHGMQRNPGYPSIEGELEKAICKAGGISAANAESFSKINWMRAARTDKGVSAVGQLVSLKMLVGQPNFDIIEHINKHLPDQIRVLGYTKTTAGFDARKHCDKRRYEYVLPAWAFDPTACRGRLCVEEAELRSAADPAAAEGVLPSDPTGTAADPTSNAGALPSDPTGAVADPTSTGGALPSDPNGAQPVQQQAGSAVESVAEATAAAVSAEAGAAKQNTVQEHKFPQENHNALAEADLPSPSPAEALQATHLGSSNNASQGTALAPQPVAQQPQGASDSPPPGDASPAQPLAQQPQASSNSPASGIAPALQSNTEQAANSTFVFDEAAGRRLNTILRQYEGTHNFHNFTVRLEATDPSAKRYMLSCKSPGTFEIKGQQWVKIVIIGQSFMLHQIRKMVGMAVAIMRGDAPANCIRIALQPQRSVPTPMAPEIGLFLDECYYDAYNTRWGADHEHVTLSQFGDRVARFKVELMYPHIAETDAKANINASWLRTLTTRSFYFQQWADEKLLKATLGPKGEKAIFNGDLLPSPAGAACIVGGQESYGMSGRGKGRLGYKGGRAGDKRGRNQEGVNGTQQPQQEKSIVDVSMEHEFSD